MAIILNNTFFRISNGSFASTEIAPVIPGLLDIYTGSNAAYSLRKLSVNATNCIQVQRSSDNSTLDIGFQSDGVLDTGSLLSFVGGNTGYVKTWYDQSGTGNDLVPFDGLTPTKWPTIVSAGTLETLNGKPSLLFSGGQTLVTATSGQSFTSGSSGLWFQFAVANSTDTSQARLICKIGNAVVVAQTIRRNTTTFLESLGYNTAAAATTDSNGVSPGSAQFLAYAQRTSTNVEIFMNNTSNGATTVTGTPQSETPSVFVLGSFNPSTITNAWIGDIQEVIHYPLDLTINPYQNDVSLDINAYYGIY